MPTDFTPADHRHMLRALALARRGLGRVEPNPMVGAVVVKNGKVVGEGFHQRFGGNHAEVWALLAAGKHTRGATLYVTLEPCCHYGKTPPCTDAILHTGIRRVVVAMSDPFPEVHGKGIALLRKQGVQVDVGLLESEAHELNAPFTTRITHHRPFIIAKWAQSLDGRVALASGDSKWISSEISRAYVHKLRGRMDAILVGINTALIDDPLLTARPARRADARRTPTRIVLDSQCRLPITSQLVRTIPEAPLLIAHARTLKPVAERRRKILAARGAMTLSLPAAKSGRPQLLPLLRHLAKNDYANLLLEGGPELLAAFFDQNLVDEAHIFLAPLIIGGPKATHAVGGGDIRSLAEARRLRILSANHSGPDLHLTLRK